MYITYLIIECTIRSKRKLIILEFLATLRYERVKNTSNVFSDRLISIQKSSAYQRYLEKFNTCSHIDATFFLAIKSHILSCEQNA